MSYYWKTYVGFFSFFISCYTIFSLLSSKKWKTKTTTYTYVFVFQKYGKFWSTSPGYFTKHKLLISEECVPLYTIWSLFTSECMAKVNNVLWQCNQSSLWKKARTSLYDFEKKLSLRVGLRAKPIKDLFFFAAWHCGPQKYDMSISQMPKRVNLSPGSFFIS